MAYNVNIEFYKIILIGNYGVGKSNILKRFKDNEFSSEPVDSSTTPNGDVHEKYFQINERVIKADIWDTANQEKNTNSMTGLYFKGSQGAILVIDLTLKDSLDSVDKWVSLLKNNITENIPIILIGNKCDSLDNRQIPEEKALEIAKTYGLIYFETSALNGTNVQKVFLNIIQEIYKKSYPEEKDFGVKVINSTSNNGSQGKEENCIII